MKNVRVNIELRFYAQLPDGDQEGDDTFDSMLDAIAASLNQQTHFEALGIVVESFTVEDGDTEADA